MAGWAVNSSTGYPGPVTLDEVFDVPPLGENEIRFLRELMNTLPVRLSTLESGHQGIRHDFHDFRTAITADLEKKHSQNRNDIHSFRNTLQDIADKLNDKIEKIGEKITALQIDNAKRSLAIGAITAVISAFAIEAAKHAFK
jgi:predicted phage tail protein